MGIAQMGQEESACVLFRRGLPAYAPVPGKSTQEGPQSRHNKDIGDTKNEWWTARKPKRAVSDESEHRSDGVMSRTAGIQTARQRRQTSNLQGEPRRTIAPTGQGVGSLSHHPHRSAAPQPTPKASESAVKRNIKPGWL
ncbi:predicted protein [Histoplasma capsulatum G186AR]|uniref:Uncharacterized protein n=1 Tax=Ajellomyces capsulatus (strain G186AR / H82 / ATCC MYA-2454 / RMSCC 2432) TaxID=447093 RepID=C0NGG6_AJECG|nr:uncharacterized protein HCBG_02438 [Histoplasma capsulatum G186AR]EEH08901.1 predicted protein [Histoplasma capsulatum G186AR]